MICNAGAVLARTITPVANLDLNLFDQTMALNFNCPVAMTKEALPHLRKTKGNILYVSSIAGKT